MYYVDKYVLENVGKSFDCSYHKFFALIVVGLDVEVFDVCAHLTAGAELLVDGEVDVVLLDLVAQLVHVEEAHAPSVQAAEVSDASSAQNDKNLYCYPDL